MAAKVDQLINSCVASLKFLYLYIYIYMEVSQIKAIKNGMYYSILFYSILVQELLKMECQSLSD